MFPDISEHQGVVDWNALGAAHAAGTIEAVSMRAGFGTVRADTQFARNQAECRARGIPAIFYWFNYPTFNSPQAEAAMFNSVVGPLHPREAMMADFEDDAASNSVFPRGPAGVAWAKAFLSAVQAPQNATWFYTYTSLFQDVGMGPLLATWPFVWADYSSRTDDPFGAIARQFTDCGVTPGVVGCCDQNRVMKGPLSRWLTGGFHMNYSLKLALVGLMYFAALGRGPGSQPEADQWAQQIGDNGENAWQVLQAIAASAEGQAYASPAAHIVALQKALAALPAGPPGPPGPPGPATYVPHKHSTDTGTP
jgi:GH25 family lysozyme M1 (1,4-beta-N-acetylmuramidase)